MMDSTDSYFWSMMPFAAKSSSPGIAALGVVLLVGMLTVAALVLYVSSRRK